MELRGEVSKVRGGGLAVWVSATIDIGDVDRSTEKLGRARARRDRLTILD